MARKLFLYSDQVGADEMDARLAEALPTGATIGYLPSSPDPDRSWFRVREKYYARFGSKLKFFGLESEFDPSQTGELLSCDAIHLTGGNTFQFSYWLRERGRIEELRQYAERGGILIGVSAGAILMTPDTGTSHLCGDVPYPALVDLSGMGLVDFAFIPHFVDSPAARDSVVRYAKGFPGAVYAVSDGGGIVVEGDRLTLCAPCLKIT